MYGYVRPCKDIVCMVMYHSVRLCTVMTMYGYVRPCKDIVCMIMYHSVRLCGVKTMCGYATSVLIVFMYDSVRPCITMYDYVGLCMA